MGVRNFVFRILAHAICPLRYFPLAFVAHFPLCFLPDPGHVEWPAIRINFKIAPGRFSDLRKEWAPPTSGPLLGVGLRSAPRPYLQGPAMYLDLSAATLHFAPSPHLSCHPPAAEARLNE